MTALMASFSPGAWGTPKPLALSARPCQVPVLTATVPLWGLPTSLEKLSYFPLAGLAQGTQPPAGVHQRPGSSPQGEARAQSLL
jgi:hypothetical protein